MFAREDTSPDISRSFVYFQGIAKYTSATTLIDVLQLRVNRGHETFY
jgi:hypothetical protein